MPEITIDVRDFIRNAQRALEERKLTCFDLENRGTDFGCYVRELTGLPCIIGAGFGEQAAKLVEISDKIPDNASIKVLIENGEVAVTSDRMPKEEITAILAGMQYRHDMMLNPEICDAEYTRHETVMRAHLSRLSHLHADPEKQQHTKNAL